MNAPKKKRYMLVDGNALIHRGYHAVPGLQTKAGEPTGAVYGFTNILLNAIKDIKPTHIGVSFDLAGPTFRHDMYKEYKAHRVAAAQELYDQIPRVKQVVRTLDMPIFEMAGFEADDVLGTLSREICEQANHDCEVFIVTGDLDTLQLVNTCVKIYTMRKGITDTFVYDEKAVRERFGLLPNQMIAYKSLRGDPSDNIPGVTGIGEKGAGELIKYFGSLDKLFNELHAAAEKLGAKLPFSDFQFPNNFQISNFKSRILNLLLHGEAQARQSETLSRIVLTVPITVDIPAYVFSPSDYQATIALLQELEFRSLVSKLPTQAVSSKHEEVREGEPEASGGQGTEKKFEQDYELVNSEEKLKKLLKKLEKVTELVVDTETTSLQPVDAQLLGISLAFTEGEAYYVPTEYITDALRAVLADENIKKIGHNLKYDASVLQANSYQLQPVAFDTMIASYLLNSAVRQHGLDTLAFNDLGYQMQSIETLIGKGKTQISMADVPVEKVAWYSAEDADMTLRLKNLYAPELKKEKLEKVFDEIEMPLILVLATMENNGIKVDTQLLNRLSGEVEIDINTLEQEIYTLTGSEFNINSPKQLKEVLFDKLHIHSQELRKTKTGLSTAAGELEKLIGQHPVIPKLLEYRELTKLQSTYLLTLPELVHKKTGRIHTNYNQTIAATGRLSSTDPNLQNIPVRGDGVGAQVRRAFIAEKGYALLSLDYSQIELRIVAHLAKDKKMTEIFKSGADIHSKTAMEIFGVTADQVTGDMRRDAKTINFGILYGVSSFGLSERIREMSRQDAGKFIKEYFKAYPAVEQYIEQVKLQVHETGFVRNEVGRMRKFPEIKSSQFFIRTAAERAAINFPIQSLAADVIKVAMINIQAEIRNLQSEIKMLLQVHDELVFEVRKDLVEAWARKIKPLMEEAIKLSVPVVVEAKAGDNWGEMKKIEF